MRTDLYEIGDQVYLREFDVCNENYEHEAVERFAKALGSYGPFEVKHLRDSVQHPDRDKDLYHPQLLRLSNGDDFSGFWFKPMNRSNVILRVE
jgi:hypothetical protein